MCVIRCEPYKLVASAGVERVVHLWQPNTPKGLAKLRGHHASVTKVVIDPNTMQLVTLAAVRAFSLKRGIFFTS